MYRLPLKRKSEYTRQFPSALAFLFWFLLVFVFSLTDSRGQISEAEIVRLLAQYDLATAREKVGEIYRQRPSSAAAAYVRALLMEDAEEAAELFDELLMRFRSSEYADRATYRLAQYYFARGLYHSSHKYFMDVMRRYPQSSLFASARYFAAKAWLAVDEADSAITDLAACVRAYPDTWIATLAQEDLSHLAPENLQQTQSSHPQFTVQIGAYGKRDNAIKQANKITALGYPVEVRERKQGKENLHLVWVGSFTTKEEAIRYGDQLKKRIGGSFQIARREP